MGKLSERTVLIVAIAVAALFIMATVAVLACLYDLSTWPWMGLFCLVALEGLPVYAAMSLRDGGAKELVFSYPNVIIPFAAVTVQGLLLLIDALFIGCTPTGNAICTIGGVILVSISLVAVFLVAKSTDYAKAVETKVKADTSFITSLLLDLQDIRANVTDEAAAAALDNLISVVRFSDPVGSDAVNEIEASICECSKKLQINPSDKVQIAEMRRLLESRNRRIKAGKE